ncbi:hypothetical protein DF3PB_5560003 [uncultured Defluviicoccus sp.]|uniref:Uncharacterized protein n=1 Tax=metagenome TaxID=256318 RepID=A0A380TJZ7_9ZZZZ|nr:hypothetical protein DF3PB_5560003 [uncultured Defluviicoccus sp.]
MFLRFFLTNSHRHGSDACFAI